MYETLSQLATLGKSMWKYRWHGVLVAWIVASIGVIVIHRIPDQYEASARIYVDTDSIMKPLMSGMKTEDEGLFVVQHRHWHEAMRRALDAEAGKKA